MPFLTPNPQCQSTETSCLQVKTTTRMALSRAHTSAKAADVTKLLLLNKHWAARPPMCSMVVSTPNRNHNPNNNPTLIQT